MQGISRNFALRLSLAIPLFLSAACSTQGYRGPARPDSEIATVYFYSAKGFDTSNHAVDGVNQAPFDMGVDVLPGPHRFYVEYLIKGQQCYLGSYCVERHYRGSCSGEFNTEESREYSIRLSGYTGGVSVGVTDSTDDSIAGFGECRNIGF